MSISRRQFLASTSLAAGAMAAGAVGVGSRYAWAAPVATGPIKGSDLVTLGDTNIKTSILGIGTGTRGGREQRELGEKAFVRLTRVAFDLGVRYIDTADMYKMHPFVSSALKELPRDKLFIQTKVRSRDAATAKADIERFRRELGIETLDTCLIHCTMAPDWTTELQPVVDVLLDAKNKGHVRAIGVSCHTLPALVAAADCPEMDVHLVRINHTGVKMDGKVEKVAAQMKRMQAKGRGVIGMKVFGNGQFKTAEQRQESLKYVLGLGTVQAFTIGFSKIEQIHETMEMIEKAGVALAKRAEE